MPIYEYECPRCYRRFERYRPSEVGSCIEKCPICKEVAHKVISKTHFRLKGGGWAKDNYCKKEE